MTADTDRTVPGPGRRVMLHGHAWRVVRMVASGEGAALTVAEPADDYAPEPPRRGASGPEATP